jgi:hypothetical protein
MNIQATDSLHRFGLRSQVISLEKFLVFGLEQSITSAGLGQDEQGHDCERRVAVCARLEGEEYWPLVG